MSSLFKFLHSMKPLVTEWITHKSRTEDLLTQLKRRPISESVMLKENSWREFEGRPWLKAITYRNLLGTWACEFNIAISAVRLAAVVVSAVSASEVILTSLMESPFWGFMDLYSSYHLNSWTRSEFPVMASGRDVRSLESEVILLFRVSCIWCLAPSDMEGKDPLTSVTRMNQIESFRAAPAATHKILLHSPLEMQSPYRRWVASD